MSRWWRKARPKVLGKLAYGFLKFIGTTVRLRTPGYEKIKALRGGVIICGWHGKSLIPGYFYRNKGVWVVISQRRKSTRLNSSHIQKSRMPSSA